MKSWEKFWIAPTRLLLVFVVIPFLQAGCSSLPQPSGDQIRSGDPNSALPVSLPIQYRKLSNGLRVVLVRDPNTPVVSYQTWFDVGSSDEDPEQAGIAHLFEHLMFKGTEKFPGRSFFTNLESAGVEINAYTTRDYTVFHADFAPFLLNRVIEMESDRMQNLGLDLATVETEKQVVLEERKQRVDNQPTGKMTERLWSLAFRQHPYRLPVIGYPDTFMNLSLENFRSFYQTHYAPDQAVVVVTGAIDPEKTWDQIVKHYSDLKPSGWKRPVLAPEPEPRGERREVIHDPTDNSRVLIAYQIGSTYDEDSFALDLLASAVFEGRSSRAYRRWVDGKPWATEVRGSSYTPRYPGLLISSATLRPGVSIDEYEKDFSALIQELQKTPFTEVEMKKARNQLTKQLIDQVASSHGQAELLGAVTLFYGSPNRYADDLRKYQKITAEQVRAAAEKYLIPNRRSVVRWSPGARP